MSELEPEDVEAPIEDAVDQRRPVVETEVVEPITSDIEAPEADALDQARPVVFEEEDYQPED